MKKRKERASSIWKSALLFLLLPLDTFSSIIYIEIKFEKGETMKIYDTIIVGAGAAGLYCAARMNPETAGSVLLLEKTEKTGTKLLMSGAGQCNLTHGGSIKDFLTCYGEKGSRIRSALYAHNNQAVCNFFSDLGVEITEREDGKIFPKSLDAHKVRDALLAAVRRNGVQLQTGADICSIQHLPQSGETMQYRVSAMNGMYWNCRNLVIACGGSSYPTTGSDGSIFPVLQCDLGIEIISPVPALTPVFVENYPFTELSGISFQNVEVTTEPGTKVSRSFTGDLLLTHRNLSGPVILNNSRHMKTGMRLTVNYVFPYTADSILVHMKKEFSANSRTAEHWLADKYSLPKRFCETIVKSADLSGRKVSTLSGGDMKTLALSLTSAPYVISGLGSFRQAMVTAGGVSLGEINLKTMEAKKYPGLYFIGEVADVDGDTGGYNLQFAFSSAAAAAKAICG